MRKLGVGQVSTSLETGSAERSAHERGAVLVLFALLLPVVLLLGVVVVDIGNWYVHNKRLQTLVDAGAFAGATKFVGCSFQFGDPVAANAAIKSMALTYAGDTAREPATLNLQEQDPDDVRVVLNSPRYWANGDPLTGFGLDDTLDTDGDFAGDPCSERALDVKGTDDDAPLLFGFLPMVIDPKRKARVEIRQVKEQSGMLPWAVPDIEPEAVVAIFVDENTGQVLPYSQLLMQKDDVSLPFSEWVTPAGDCSVGGPECVDLASENTGVIILVSKVNDDPLRTGTLAQICGQAPGLVTCYAGAGNQDGLTFIHGWSDIPGSPANPQVRDVSLFAAANCADDLSAPYFLRSAETCDIGATAVIDFGFDPNPTPNPPTGIHAIVKLRGPGCGSHGCTMQYVGEASAANESIWMTSQLSTLDENNLGRQNYSISWQTESPAGVDHSGTFGGVAHPYVADGRSGPVDYLKITTSDPLVLDPNSRNTGPPRSVIVTVGIRKPLRIEDPLATPLLLRVASPSGSQNQAFDCDKHRNFQTEIELGCQTTYGLNYDDWDVPKDGSKEWADINCDGYDVGDLPPDSPTNTPAPICVAVETGDKIGQFRQGLSKRFENPTCWPNNWPQDQGAPGHDPADDAAIHDFFTNYDFANDPRYVTLIITDFGTFQGSGNDQVPVKYFAGFYATGWDVVGTVKSCLDNDPHPWYGTNYRKSLDNGDVWGHFVNIVVFSASGLPNDQLCNFDELGNCIAVLVE